MTEGNPNLPIGDELPGHPLEGAWTKLDRADHHLKELHTEIMAIPRYPQRVHFVQKFDPEESAIHIAIEGVPELPIKLSLMAADYLQNLRAALNYLAWELARWNLRQTGKTREPASLTQFPINTKPGVFSHDRIADLHPDHVERIKALQPNQVDPAAVVRQDMESIQHLMPSDPPPRERAIDIPEGARQGFIERQLLAHLARLTNDDKHRILRSSLVQATQMTMGAFAPVDCEIAHTNIFLFNAMQNGTKWAKLDVRPTGPEPKVDVNEQFVIDVTFGGCTAFTDLPNIGLLVIAIIQMFEPIFVE